MRKLFGTDGIRAIAGEAPLDKRTIHAIGIALARHLGHQPRLILGMDTRESGPWIAATLTAGLIQGGATVESAGIITTPAIAYLARKHNFSAGIVISASHNPWQDNGIKIFGGDGYKLPDDTELAIEAEIEHVLASEYVVSFRMATNPSDFLSPHLPASNDAYRAEYVRFLLDAVPNLSLDNRTVVIDCANGAASSIAPQLFADLQGTVEVTHASPDGRNINANCGALHPEIVAAEVKLLGASMGFTFDGDADRALFADEHGNVVNGDAVMLACARDLQSRGELAGNLVVATTMSNMGLEAAFARSGIQMLRAPVGDKYVRSLTRRRAIRPHPLPRPRHHRRRPPYRAASPRRGPPQRQDIRPTHRRPQELPASNPQRKGPREGPARHSPHRCSRHRRRRAGSRQYGPRRHPLLRHRSPRPRHD